MSRLELTFGLLVLAQAAHSLEEYLGRLWERFNGIGHPLWSLRQGGYTPGLATATSVLYNARCKYGPLRVHGPARLITTALPAAPETLCEMPNSR